MDIVTIENDIIASADYISAKDHALGQDLLNLIVNKINELTGQGIEGVSALFTNDQNGIVNNDLQPETISDEAFFLYFFAPGPNGKPRTVVFFVINITEKKVYDFSQNIIYG
jgi:hypothetical protein